MSHFVPIKIAIWDHLWVFTLSKEPPQLLYTCTHENKETLGFPISQIDLRSLLAGVEGALATGRAPQQLSTRGVSTAALEVMGPYSTHLKLTC